MYFQLKLMISDITDVAQLAIFICSVEKRLAVSGEFLELVLMTPQHLFLQLSESLIESWWTEPVWYRWHTSMIEEKGGCFKEILRKSRTCKWQAEFGDFSLYFAQGSTLLYYHLERLNCQPLSGKIFNTATTTSYGNGSITNYYPHKFKDFGFDWNFGDLPLNLWTMDLTSGQKWDLPCIHITNQQSVAQQPFNSFLFSSGSNSLLLISQLSCCHSVAKSGHNPITVTCLMTSCAFSLFWQYTLFLTEADFLGHVDVKWWPCLLFLFTRYVCNRTRKWHESVQIYYYRSFSNASTSLNLRQK